MKRLKVNGATRLKSPPAADKSAHLRGSGKVYVRFELDARALARVERLAKAAGCTPFQMCVNLLEKRLSRLENGRDA